MPPTTVGAYEAKTRLPELLRAVSNGQSFTITHRDRPVARLVPATTAGTDAAQAVQAMQVFIARQAATAARHDADALDALRREDQR